jgi:uncharacterized protein YggE
MKKLVLVLFLTVSISAFSQNGEKNFIDQNYIEVTGKAEMDIIPDLIYLKIILSDKDNKNKQSLDEIEKSMINSLTGLGLDIKKDLSILDFASSFKLFWIGKTDIVLTKEYQLIVHDTRALQNVYLEFQKLGISNVNIDKLDHSKIEQFRKDVKVNAIRVAKEKAESLTSSINQTIGKAIYIQELDYQYISDALSGKASGVNIHVRGSSSLFEDDSQMPDIEFGKINLHYSILVRFELK